MIFTESFVRTCPLQLGIFCVSLFTAVRHPQREGGKRPKRGRSERSMTLPNNVFDVASRLFTSSSSTEPMVCKCSYLKC